MTKDTKSTDQEQRMDHSPEPPKDHKVGYDKPPKAAQCEPGESRPRRARKRKDETILDIVRRVAMERVRVPTLDGVVKMPMAEAVIFVNHQKSLQGNAMAGQNIFDYMEAAKLFAAEPTQQVGGYITIPEPCKTEEEFEALVAHYEAQERKDP